MDYQEAIYCMKVMADEEVCEECNYYQSCDHTKQADMARIVISAMQELQEYKKLGTLEEARDAVERMQEKKVTDIRGNDKLKFCTCPYCGRRIANVEGGNYCQNCGQKLDWSEEENEQISISD